MRLPERPDVLEQTADLGAVQADLVGHGQLEQSVEHGPYLGRTAERDAGVHARPRPEPVRRVVTAVGPQQGGVAHVQRVALVVDLEHEPDAPDGQLLLVGLDPQRDPDQLGQRRAGKAPAALGHPLADPVTEVRGTPRGGGAGRRCGRRPRQRVGDGIEHLPHQHGCGGWIDVVVRPGPGQPVQAVAVARVEAVDAPARCTLGRGRELARRDQPGREQRGAAEQRHARVHVVAGVRPAEDR